MVDVTATLSAITAALGLAKELRDIDHQIDKAELKLKVADLTGALADAKVGLVEITELLQAKDAEITRLSEFEIDLSNKILKNGFHMDAFDDGTPRGDPYCPYCIERKAGLFRLRELDRPGRPSGCPHCKTVYPSVPRYFYEKR